MTDFRAKVDYWYIDFFLLIDNYIDHFAMKKKTYNRNSMGNWRACIIRVLYSIYRASAVKMFCCSAKHLRPTKIRILCTKWVNLCLCYYNPARVYRTYSASRSIRWVEWIVLDVLCTHTFTYTVQRATFIVFGAATLRSSVPRLSNAPSVLNRCVFPRQKKTPKGTLRYSLHRPISYNCVYYTYIP